MDPWNVSAVSDTSDPRRPSQVFDNSFLELDKPVYHKLQDSEHYISKLEEKLKNITTGKQGTNASDSVSARDLVSAVSSAKEDALVRLVRSGSVAQGEDLDLDTDINTTYLYRRLNPKVAVTQGEKVILLAADQLAKALQDTTESKDDVGKNEPSEDSDNSVENDSTQDQQQR